MKTPAFIKCLAALWIIVGVIWVASQHQQIHSLRWPWEWCNARPFPLEEYQFFAVIVALCAFFGLFGYTAWEKQWSSPCGYSPTAARRMSPAHWAGLGILVVLMVVTRVPLLDEPLTRDEMESVARNAVGWRDGTSGPIWQPTWREMLFENRYGNNSAPTSLLTSASNYVFGGGIGGAGKFHPVALRLPFFLAAIAAVVVWFRFLHAIAGFPVALAGAFLFAMHPGHQLYSVRARCYALVLLGVTLLIPRLWRWRHGDVSVKNAGLIVLSSWLLLWIFPGVAYWLIAVWCWLIYSAIRVPAGLLRIGVWWLVLAPPFLWLAVPLWVQSGYFMSREFEFHGQASLWVPRCLSWILCGLRLPYDAYEMTIPDDSLLPWERTFGRSPVVSGIVFVLLPCLAWWGGRCWCKALPNSRFLMLLVPLATIVSLIHHVLFTNIRVLDWYFIWTLPGIALLFAGVGLAEKRPLIQLTGVVLGYLLLSWPSAQLPSEVRVPLYNQNREWPARMTLRRGRWLAQKTGPVCIEYAVGATPQKF